MCITCYFIFFLYGCTQVVHVKHTTQVDTQNQAMMPAGIATKVLVQPIAYSNKETHKQSGIVVIGIANSWDVDLNETIPTAIKETVNKTYEHVELGITCNDCGLIVRPTVVAVRLNKLSMQAHVDLNVNVYDSYGTKITGISSQGSSAYLDGLRVGTSVAAYFIPMIGSALGNTIVRKTVGDALDDALADFSQQLENQANTGVLARTWVPNPSLSKRQTGKHQFAAEQVAKVVGCNINSDGISLNKKEYFKETYTAKCWGQPEFSILCADGRCELDKNDQPIAQTQQKK